ncbi:MAG: hypothetical protein H3C62_00835 [Gemmatimonadaceae bacterium]|nr:hypothetical protein [Gemmatimonadaceae bacterium]
MTESASTAGPRWLTGPQRLVLLESLSQLQDLARAAQAQDIATWAADWHHRMESAPTVEAAAVSAYRTEMLRCLGCVEEAMTADAGTMQRDVDRDAAISPLAALQQDLQRSVTAANASAAPRTVWLPSEVATDLVSDLRRHELAGEQAGWLVVPILLRQLRELLSRAQDGRAVEVQAAEEARAQALTSARTVLERPALSDVANAAVLQAIAAMGGKLAARVRHAEVRTEAVRRGPHDVATMMASLAPDTTGAGRTDGTAMVVDAGKLSALLSSLTVGERAGPVPSSGASVAPSTAIAVATGSV